MNAWEHCAKLAVKGRLWAPVYLIACSSLGLTNSWQLVALIIICALCGDLLDALIPTEQKDRTNG